MLPEGFERKYLHQVSHVQTNKNGAQSHGSAPNLLIRDRKGDDGHDYNEITSRADSDANGHATDHLFTVTTYPPYNCHCCGDVTDHKNNGYDERQNRREIDRDETVRQNDAQDIADQFHNEAEDD